MVSANPTGPITVASARNGAYGDSVARLLEFAGHEVEREYYYNDAGAQMDRFRASVEARRRGEEPPEDGYQGEYIAELAHAARRSGAADAGADRGDDGALPDPLRLLGEAERARAAAARVPAAPGHVREGRRRLGALVGLRRRGRPRPRSAPRRGRPTYRAADVVYLADKLDRGFDRALYVLGADHHGTRNWYAAVARMLGYDPERVEVLLYQLVHLTSGGEAAKMSKRRGDVVFLDELLDEVGVDAARWYLVSRGPDQTIEIDVDLAAEKTAEEPRLLRPVRARPDRGDPPQRRGCCALGGAARRAGGRGARPVKRLAEFPAVVAEATERRGPHAIPNYAIRVADDFHRFYHEHKVLGSDAEAFRLGLVTATKAVIARGARPDRGRGAGADVAGSSGRLRPL